MSTQTQTTEQLNFQTWVLPAPQRVDEGWDDRKFLTAANSKRKPLVVSREIIDSGLTSRFLFLTENPALELPNNDYYYTTSSLEDYVRRTSRNNLNRIQLPEIKSYQHAPLKFSRVDNGHLANSFFYKKYPMRRVHFHRIAKKFIRKTWHESSKINKFATSRLLKFDLPFSKKFVSLNCRIPNHDLVPFRDRNLFAFLRTIRNSLLNLRRILRSNDALSHGNLFLLTKKNQYTRMSPPIKTSAKAITGRSYSPLSTNALFEMPENSANTFARAPLNFLKHHVDNRLAIFFQSGRRSAPHNLIFKYMLTRFNLQTAMQNFTDVNVTRENLYFSEVRTNRDDLLLVSTAVLYHKTQHLRRELRFNIPLHQWSSVFLVRFLEHCSGKKACVRVFTYLMTTLSIDEKMLCSVWMRKMYYFQTAIGQGFFLEEALQILYLVFKLKDPFFLMDWAIKTFKKISFWRYKFFFMFFKYATSHCFIAVFEKLGIKGFKIKLKGKIGVTGNSRTRSLRYSMGRVTASTATSKTLYALGRPRTFTGIQGFQIWLTF